MSSSINLHVFEKHFLTRNGERVINEKSSLIDLTAQDVFLAPEKIIFRQKSINFSLLPISSSFRFLAASV